MPIYSIREQPGPVRRAIKRIVAIYGQGKTPIRARNAVELVMRLHRSGIAEEDELVELARLSGGSPIAERLSGQGLIAFPR